MSDNEKSKVNKDKILQEKSFIMDINILEAPFFLFNQSNKAMKVKDIKKNPNTTKEVQHILQFHGIDEGEAKYFNWRDSKGMTREMLALTSGKLPRKFTMDVWYGIVGLYIKKSSPIFYNNKMSCFEIENDRLYFTLYELAKFMKLTTGGANLRKIQDGIRQLKNTQYYSFSNGSIYDKKNEEYIKTSERGLSLILEYEFNSKKQKPSSWDNKSKCWVQLNSLVIDNIKHEFIKYLNSETYFSLPSGITRGLYTYLEGNKYTNNGLLTYIKRSFNVLANKIPVEFKYNSELKKKLKKPLENLIKGGIITDYFYGDEYIINEKDYSIYFVFKGSKDDIIKELQKKYQEKQNENKKLLKLTTNKEDSFTMEIPKNLDETLAEIGFSDKVIKQLYLNHDKWDIIKYVIWLQKQLQESKGTVKNKAGLLRFALESNEVNLNIPKFKDIIQFVDKKKEEYEKSKLSKEDILNKAYESYVSEEIDKFKKEDDGTYEIIYDNILINIDAQLDKQLAQLRLIQNETNEALESLELWEEYKEKREESRLFIRNLTNSIKTLRGIKTKEEFQIDFKY